MHQQRKKCKKKKEKKEKKKMLVFKNDQKNDWLCKIIELCAYEMFK